MDTRNFGPVGTYTCSNCGARHRVIGHNDRKPINCLCGALVDTTPSYARRDREWPERVGRYAR